MSVSVRIPTILRTYTGGESEVSAEGGTPMLVSADRYASEYWSAPAPNDPSTVAFTGKGRTAADWWRKGHSHIDESEIWLLRDNAGTPRSYLHSSRQNVTKPLRKRAGAPFKTLSSLHPSCISRKRRCSLHKKTSIMRRGKSQC